MSLFRLKINGEFVVMPNAQVSMNVKSPVFKEEGEARTRTYTFKVPASVNENIFRLTSMLSTRDIVLDFQGELYIGDTFYRRCEVKVTSFSNDFYELRAVVNSSAYHINKNRLLSEFSYQNHTRSRSYQPACIYYDFQFALTVGAPTTGGTTLFIEVEQLFFKYFKKTYSIAYNGGENLAVFLNRVVATINADFTSHGYFLTIQGSDKIRFTDNWSNGLRNDPTFTPIDVDYFNYLDLVVNTSFFSPNFGTQAIQHANSVVATPSNYDYIFAPIYMSYSDNNVKVVNLWQPDVYDGYGPGFRSMTGSAIPDSNKRNSLIPMPYLYSVIELIHKELNIELDNQFFDDELKKLVLVPNIILSDNYNLTFHNINLHYADLVPDLKLIDFIREIEKLFNIVFDYDSKDGYCRIVKKNDIINSSSFIDLTEAYTDEFRLRERFYEEESGLGYTFKDDEYLLSNSVGYNQIVDEEVDTLPTITAYNTLKVKKSDNIIYKFTGVWLAAASGLVNFYNKFNQAISPIDISIFDRKPRVDSYIGSRTISWIIPFSNSKVFYYTQKGEKNNIRLLFYRGFQPCTYQTVSAGTTVNGTYPMLDYHNYNRNNDRIGEYTLSFYGTDGLYNRFHKSWNNFLYNSMQLEFNLILDANSFNQIDFLKPIMIKNQLFIISEMDLKFNGQHIVCKTRAFKVIRK
jgi:hypothetical protein